MNILKPNQETKVAAYFCMQCGSASIARLDTLSGVLYAIDKPTDRYVCTACNWEGARSELLATEVTHELGSNDDITVAMMADLRLHVAKGLAEQLLRFLLKWGFMAKSDPKMLARYLTVAGRAMMLAIIDERSKIDEEVSRGN